MTTSPLKPTLLLGAAALLATGTLLPSDAAARDGEEMPFTVAQILIQLNDTDGDLGFHARIDGEPWTRLKIEAPNGKTLLKIRNVGPLRRQGLTELAFESAEPQFDEVSPEEFFERFPEGDYEISADKVEGGELESIASFTHVVPAAPELVHPLSDDCDEPDPVAAGPVTLLWNEVTESHPEIGRSADIEILHTIVTLEREEPAPTLRYDVELPGNATELEIPDGFLALGTVFKYQVLVREASGNETSSESCFSLES